MEKIPGAAEGFGGGTGSVGGVRSNVDCGSRHFYRREVNLSYQVDRQEHRDKAQNDHGNQRDDRDFPVSVI